MKSLKTTLLTLLLFIGFIVPSCNKEDHQSLPCSCEEFQYFDVEGILLTQYPLDPSGEKTLNANDTLQFEELGHTILKYEASFHASALPGFDWSFSLMNTANACSCAGGSKGSKKEKLISLSIITLHDFDADHPAGSEINDLFDYNEVDFGARSFEGFVEEAKGKLLDTHFFNLQLKKAPAMDTDFQLKASVKLSTGEIYQAESLPLFIKI